MTWIGIQNVLVVNNLPPEVIESLWAVENCPAGELVGATSKSRRCDGCIANLIGVLYRPVRSFFVIIYVASITYVRR